MQPIFISMLIEETLSFCKERFKSHGVKLELIESKPGLEVECRAVEISQVVLNLLNNAYDAIETLPEKWIRVETIDTGHDVEIRITDSGSGIPKEVREKMMQPFFTTKEIGKGTGLGLSISRGIAQAHYGQLKLNEKHPNTQFILVLPKSQECAAARSKAA